MQYVPRSCAHALLIALIALLVGSFTCSKSDEESLTGDEALQRQFESASEGPVELVIQNGRARTVRGKIGTTGSSAEQRARSFLDGFADAFGLSDISADCSLMGQIAVLGGGDVVLFGRQVNGIPVFGSEIRVRLDGQGNVVHVSALLPSTVEVATEAAVSSEQAGSTATSHAKALGVDGAQVDSAELGIYDPVLLTGEAKQVLLAWLVRLDGDDPLLPALVVVDATTGDVLLAFNIVDRARKRNVYEVLDAAQAPRSIIEGQRTLLFTEGDAPPPASAPAQLLADYQIYEHAGIVYDFFADTFGWDSWDGKGAPINIYLRYGGRTSWMLNSIFIDPDGASFDSVAHEFGHGLTNAAMQGNANAEKAKLHEPGALKESLSDLVAVFASLSAPGVAGDWQITDGKGQVDRDLKQITYPTIRHYKDYKHLPPGADPWYSDDKVDHDKGYVHYNSAIPSMAAYRLMEGGTHPTDASSPPVIGIGLEKTMQIYFRAIRYYLQHTGTFEDARYALLRACEDFAYRNSENFDIEIRDCGSLLNAWAAVGVGERDQDRDTWSDSIDNCPKDFNPVQEDIDHDKIGDACSSSEPEKDAGTDAIPPSALRCQPVFESRLCEEDECPDRSTCVTVGPANLSFVEPDGTPSTTHEEPEFSTLYNYYLLRCAYHAAGSCNSKYGFMLKWRPKGLDSPGAGGNIDMSCGSPGELYNDCTLLGSSTMAHIVIPCLSDGVPAVWRQEVLAHAEALLAAAEAEAEPCP